MLRVLFGALATFALLLGAGLWFAGRDAPQGVEQALAPLLERSMKIARSIPRWLPQSAPEAERPPAAPPIESPTAPQRVASSRPAANPVPAPPPVAAEPRAPQQQAVSEEWIDPLASEPFFEAPIEESSATATAQPPGLARAPSQDEWAGLIRRMLAIYERVGAVE
jgi:hypothetical protein